MSREEIRDSDQLRPIKVTKDYMKHAEGSCLIEFGDTKIICTAVEYKKYQLRLCEQYPLISGYPPCWYYQTQQLL